MLITSATLQAVFMNFRADYQAGLLAVKPLKERIAMMTNSVTRSETYGWLGNTNRLREWIGARIINSLVAHDFTIRNRTFENTVAVPREDVEDDRIGIFSGAFQLMGQDAALHPDELLFELIRQGTTQLSFDGRNFFDTAHPLDPSVSNSPTVSNANMTAPDAQPKWVLLDTTQVVRPFIFQTRKDYTFVRKDRETDANVFFENTFLYGVEARVNAGYGLWQLAYASDKELTAENFAKARGAMMSLKAPTGKPLGIIPDLMLLSPEFDEDARRLLNIDTSPYYQAIEFITTPWMA